MKTFNFFEKLWEHSRTLRRVGLVLVMCLIAIPQMEANGYYLANGYWGQVDIYFNDHTTNCNVGETGDDQDLGADPVTLLSLTGFRVNVYQGSENQISWSKMYYRFYKYGSTPPSYSYTNNAGWKSNNGGTNGWWENSQHQTWELTNQDIYLVTPTTESGYYYFDFYFNTDDVGYLSNNSTQYRIYFTVADRVLATNYTADGGSSWSNSERTLSDGSYTIYNVAASTDIDFKMALSGSWYNAFGWDNVGGNTGVGNLTLKSAGSDNNIRVTTPSGYRSDVTFTYSGSTVSVSATPHVYSITYKDGGDKSFTGAHMPDYPTTHTSGTATTLKKASKAGYVFGGWYTDSGCTGSAVTSLGATAYTANITLYAKWTAASLSALEDNELYTADEMVPDGLTIDGTEKGRAGVSANNRFDLLGSGTSNATGGPMMSKNDAKKVDGVSFTPVLYFKGAGSGNPSGTTVPTSRAIKFVVGAAGNLELFVRNSSVIKMLKSGGSAAALGSGNSSSYEKITKEVTAGTYYLYATDGSSTLYGIRFIPTYTVSVASNNEDYGTVNKSSITKVPYGTSITTSTNTLTINGTTVTASYTAATAEYTYAFSNWTKGDGTALPSTVTSALSIRANFTRTANNYTLTWTTDGDDLTGDYTSGTVAYGAAITAPNTPTKTGYTFSAWSPSPAATMPAANTEYTAIWTAKTTTITLDPNTANHGSGDETEAVATYDATSLTSVTHTTPEAGYQLKGYYTAKTDGTKIINADGSFVTANTDYTTSGGAWKYTTSTATLYAQYEEVDYCYEFDIATSGSAPALYDAVLGTGDDGMNVEAQGSSTAMGYNSYGIKFNKSGDKLRVSLPNKLQEGSVIVIKQYATGKGDNRGITLKTAGGTKVEDIIWSPAASAEEKTITYTVTSSDGLKNNNVFLLERKTNSYLKSVKVGNCSSTAATKYNLSYSLTNVSLDDGIAAGSSAVVNGRTFIATFTDDTGYDLPSTITVTIGGESATANTDYYWTQATGKLVIPGAKVTGNIAVTITGVAECTPHGLAYATGSVTKTLCDGTYKNTLMNPNSLSVTYTSSATDVATVASDGTVTLKKAGSATITASYAGDATYCEGSASYTLTISSSTAAGLAYGTSTVKKNVGDDNFTNSLTNSNSLTVSYESSNTSVATVDSDGEVTIKGAGTTTITASAAQQKVSSTCYAAGSASYTLTVYPVYTVTYNAMGGTCATSSATTDLGEVTLPTATHGDYTSYTWVKSDGIEAGDAGDTYTPEGNINLYAKWSGSCAGGESCEYKYWFRATTDAPSAVQEAGKAQDDFFTNTPDGSSGGSSWSNKWEIDGVEYSATYRAGNSSNICTFTIPSGYTATLYLFGQGSSSRALILKEAGDPETELSGSAALTDNPFKVTISDLGAGTYTATASGNVGIAFIIVKLCSSGGCFTVTYDGNGATSGYVNDPAKYESGTTVYTAYNSSITGFKRTGYEFNGWNTKADGSGDKVSYFTITENTTLYAQWRYLIDSNNEDFEGYDDAPTQYQDVRVTKGAKLTLTKSTNVHDITVETGSTLHVSTNGGSAITLATNSISLVGGWGTVGSSTKYDMPRVYVDPASKITKDVKTINFDIAVDNRNFYPIAVPFPVTVSDIDYADAYLAYYSLYGTNGQYIIKTYDGQVRANYGGISSCWKTMNDGVMERGDSGTEPTDVLQPGKGYILRALPANAGGWHDDYAIIRFPMKNVDDEWTNGGEKGSITVAAVTTTKNVVPVTAYLKQGDAEDAGDKTPMANRGWNILGVPYMSCYTTSSSMGTSAVIQGKFNYETNKWESGDIRYVTVPTHDFSEYIQEDIDDNTLLDDDPATVLLPGWCFFVQIGTTGNLTFLAADEAESTTFPYRVKNEDAPMPTLKTGIILSGNGAKDKTNFLISDKYSASEYEINADLEKMFGENGYTLATYSISGNTRFAYNAMSNADAANIIPIGYRAPEEGEYTFSINPRYAENGAFEHVNLIDYETGIMTDLLMGSYTFSTERTQLDTRFALNVVPRQNTPTDIETVGGEGINDANAPRKVLINDKMYIIVDGKMYDATGKAVK